MEAEVEGWLHCVNSRGQKGLLPSSFVRILGPGESYPPPASQRNRPPSVDYFSQVPADLLCCGSGQVLYLWLQISKKSAVLVAADSMGTDPEKSANMLTAAGSRKPFGQQRLTAMPNQLCQADVTLIPASMHQACSTFDVLLWGMTRLQVQPQAKVLLQDKT